MRVQLIGEVSGTRNGQQWPPRFSVVDLPDDEAIRLCDQKMARPVVESVEDRAVVEPAEDHRVLDGPAAAAADEVPAAPVAVEPSRRRTQRA